MQNLNLKVKSDIRNRCYQFALDVIKLTEFLPNKRVSWIITDQLIRSATSIGANLVEAKASTTRLEYKKFYEIGLKSAHETGYWLSLLFDAKLVSEDKILPLKNELYELICMLSTGVIKLKNKVATF